tara:strand:- start:129 stop:341 length:213 start_codon:yes stop_codon:yes gene_type:complete
MKVFKVTTSWTGFSEITVEAETQEEAKVLVEKVEYDTDKEVLTGYGLDYGYENEEIIEVKEIEESEDETN